jgi:glycosyltransferase involved in cell wall biosynthesis
MNLKPIRVCFTPFDAINPYQRALAHDLEPLGVDVVPRRSLRGLAARVCRGLERPDIVHLHWLPTVEFRARSLLQLLVFLIRVRLLKLLRCRFVWTAHNLHHHEARHPSAEHWLGRRIVNSAARVIVHSQAAERLVTETFGIADPEKLVVIPHGTYRGLYRNTVSAGDARARLRLEQEAVVVLFFGNIRAYKGVSELVAAYDRAGTADSRLLIVGKADAAILATIEQAVANRPRIRLQTGFVADDDVQLYMNASDVVVFPYQEVLTSGAVVLAMSFGRACIAPAWGCIQELTDARGAFLYNPRDPDGLANAIERALSSRARFPEMGAQNLRRADEWGWDKVARQTAAVYASALGRSIASTGGRARGRLPLAERMS